MLEQVSNDLPIGKMAFSVKETAELFQPKVNPITVYRLVYSGKIRVLDGLGIIRIPRSELEKFFSKVVVYTPRKMKRKAATGAV